MYLFLLLLFYGHCVSIVFFKYRILLIPTKFVFSGIEGWYLFIYLFIYLSVAKWHLGNPSNPSSEKLITALETVKMATTYDFSKLFVTALFIYFFFKLKLLLSILSS